MTPQMEAALSGRSVILAGLMRIQLPGHTIRLCDGGTTRWGEEQFTAKDPLYGVLGEIEQITEGIGDTIPALEFVLIPPSLAQAVALCHPDNEGSSFRLWMAVVDRATGLVVPDPELQFAGDIDVPTLEIDEDNTFGVRISIASVFEQLFEPDEGVRLADTFHQFVFPGELGLANMTSTPIDTLWGPGQKNPAVSYVGA